ncbi:uncharacterized protein A4U43_C08F16260, partial [Asparagus officinalis]
MWSSWSRVYINIDDPKVKDLSQRNLNDSEESLQIIPTPVNFSADQPDLTRATNATLNDLLFFNDPETSSEYYFICEVIIIGIIEHMKWRYSGCPGCSKKSLIAGNSFWCEKCNKQVMAQNCYKITLEVEDYSVVSTITLFNREAEKLFKVSADEVAKNLVKIKGREVFPSLLKGIVGKKIKVQIKVTKYNYIEGNEGFTVMKLIEDLHDRNKESYNDNAQQDVFAPQESPVISLTKEGPPATPTTPLIAITNLDLRNNTNIMIKPKIEKVVNNNSVGINSIEVEEKAGSTEQFKVPMQEGYNKSWLHFIIPLLPEDSSRYFFNRLWQDAENRMLLSDLVHRSATHRKIVEAEMDLTLAKSQGYLRRENSSSPKKLLAVVGVYTGFGSKLKRNVFRGSWMPTGDALRKLEDRGVVIRFVIGRSANRGDSLDRIIDEENLRTKDFMILESHEEAVEELPKKAKFFFSAAVERWDAEFYVKVDDSINLNLDGLIEILESHRGRNGVYMGCMKSGSVITDENHALKMGKSSRKTLHNCHECEESARHAGMPQSLLRIPSTKGKQWYEPQWWKFGDGKSYFRHASGSLFILSKNLARYVNINSASLQTYAHDDISVGSWMMGLDTSHVDDDRLCCSSSRQ